MYFCTITDFPVPVGPIKSTGIELLMQTFNIFEFFKVSVVGIISSW